MVKLRQYRRRGVASGGWEVDVRVELPAGGVYRERKLYRDSSSKAEARAWGEDREHEVRALARRGLDLERVRRVLNGEVTANATEPDGATPVTTMEAFWPRFMEGYAKANQEKPSTIETRERIWKTHLKPALGSLVLHEINDEQVQRLKGRLSAKKPKTVNNILTILNKLLKVAVEWRVIEAMPCTIRLLKSAKPVVEFYEPDEYERLVAAAPSIDVRAHVAVLLGGDAGLRLGEVLAVEWSDVDFTRGLIKVQRAVYGDAVTLPKGGKPRIVPMTERLKQALQAHRHLRGERVLYQDDGTAGEKWWLKWMLDKVERRAGLRRGGRVHILRHTFCSRLAAVNVPMLTIKELAGHVSLETTQRYMHLSSSAPREGIRALEAALRGGGVEAGEGGAGKPSGSRQ